MFSDFLLIPDKRKCSLREFFINDQNIDDQRNHRRHDNAVDHQIHRIHRVKFGNRKISWSIRHQHINSQTAEPDRRTDQAAQKKIITGRVT